MVKNEKEVAKMAEKKIQKKYVIVRTRSAGEEFAGYLESQKGKYDGSGCGYGV